MRLVQKIELIKPQGAKVMRFELSLLDLGGDRYVVNYRQGLAGGSTYEGTVTLRPLSRIDANRAFDRTVEQKRREGFVSSDAAPVAPAAAPKPAPQPRPQGATKRTQPERYRTSLRGRLRDYAAKGKLIPADEKRLGTALASAALVSLPKVEPALLKLFQNAPPARRTLVAWALGKSGSMASVAPLGALYGDSKAPAPARHAAAEALLALSDAASRETFRAGLRGELPAELRALRAPGEADAFSLALSKLLDADSKHHELIARLYLISDPASRPALLEYARSARLSPPSFRQLRRLYRSAIFRGDAELFGILAHRFETTGSNYQYSHREHRSPEAGDEMARKGQRAFGEGTRKYLRRSAWRVLLRLGALGSEAFVPMAVGALLPYTDSDARESRRYRNYNNHTQRYEVVQSSAFASYYLFNRLLHRGNMRVGVDHKQLMHAIQDGLPYVPGGEAFPQAWKARPQGLLHLLDESRCELVHRFAVGALSECTSFCDALDLEVLKMLLGRPYEVTARLGFELAMKRLDPKNLDIDLLLVMATCAYAPARQQSHAWLLEQAERIAQQTATMAALVLGRYPDAQELARKILGRVRLNEPTARVLLGRVVAGLLALGEHDGVRAAGAGRLLFDLYPKLAGGLGARAVDDLLARPLLEVQIIGADIALNAPELPTDELIQRLVESPFDALVERGVRLMQRLPTDTLAQRPLVVARMLTSKNEAMRRESRALARLLCRASAAFAPALTALLLDALLRNKLPEGVPDQVRKLLLEEYNEQLLFLEGDRLLRLLESKSPQAQFIGAYLLNSRDMSAQFSVDVLARLCDSETAAVREAAHHMLETSLDRVKQDMPGVVRVLDSPWDDTRVWAFHFLRTNFTTADFTADVLVSICDSIRPDVQAFGRELLSVHFRDEDGATLMLRLSEHPTAPTQLLVTNYLTAYASRQPERIRALMPYFSAVLNRVNKGRVAKVRVFEFLQAEAVASDEVAEEVLPLLYRLTASVAVQSRSSALEAIAAIRRAHPTLTSPVPLLQPEARHGVPVRLPR